MINALNRNIFGTGGGASATIYVTGLSESDTVTMTTPSGGSVVGEWGEEQGESVFIFHANEYGMHTITASNGTKTSTEEVLVDALMDYWVEMDLSKLYLYKYGDSKIAWDYSKLNDGSGWSLGTHDSLIDAEQFVCASYPKVVGMMSTNKVNLSNANKICVLYSKNATSEMLMCTISTNSYMGAPVNQRTNTLYDDETFVVKDKQIIEYALNNKSDAYVSIYIVCPRGKSNATATVYAIWLE